MHFNNAPANDLVCDNCINKDIIDWHDWEKI